MEIQLWEGAPLKCAETALQGTTHDKVSAKSDSGHKVPQKLWLKRVKNGSIGRQRTAVGRAPKNAKFSSWRV
jgi:hypothetical protein